MSEESGENHEEQGGEVPRRPLLPPAIRRKLAFFLAPLALAATLVAGYGHYTDPGPLPEARTFVIPHGGMQAVTQALQQDGLIAPGRFSGAFFRAAAALTRREGALHAAEFAFPQRVSMAKLLDILRHGRPVPHSLTVPEGLTALRIARIIQDAPVMTGETPAIAEGGLFPQTVSYVWGTERKSVVDRLARMMTQKLQSAWEKRDVSALDGLIRDPRELLVLASLIERETALPAERPMVARVFLNRLRLGMRLQTDPSVIYGLSDGAGVLERPLTHEDLGVDTPYNTYLHDGLPPGPICSPGESAIEAAAHPAIGKALYFVASGEGGPKGGHRFAETLEEQDRNIRAWRANPPR